MPNRHIKVINGRKYYYESVRKGKKVTSRYLGPVERIRKRRKDAADVIELEQEEPLEKNEDENNYIG